MGFQIIRNDITKVKADAIVNTANPSPVCGGGTDYAIYQAAGMDRLLAERKKIGDIARGQAVETPAFDLHAKYIIHTVGPAWEGGENGEVEILKSCYENSLNLALELGCESIAFPLIATGVYGFPKAKALQIALSIIQPFVMEHDMQVTLVVFGDKAVQLSGAVVDRVREFVDSHYVEQACRDEYAIDDGQRISNMPPRERELLIRRNRRRREYAAETCAPYEDSVGAAPKAPAPKAAKPAKAEKEHYIGVPVPVAEKVDYDELVGSLDKSFRQKLFEIIDARGLKSTDVYKDYISKQVYSKILSNKDYHPNKSTAILLCMALHLSLEETKDMLGRAGWALNPSSKADMVVAGCIQNGEYDPVEVNIILYSYDCPTLAEIK